MKKALALLLAAAAAAGCGYSATRLLPATYRTIHIEPFPNNIPINEESTERGGFQTSLPGLQEKVTQGVISRFLFDGNLRVKTDPGGADLVMTGSLNDFYRQALFQREDRTAEEYRLNLVASVTLRDGKGNLLWGPVNIIGDTTYVVGQTAESTAVQTLVDDLSRRVVERVIEDW